MTNTASGSYKGFGDVQLPVIKQLLQNARSPMIETYEATTAAVAPHSALFWAQAWLENQWETTGKIIKPADHNPVSLRPWEADPTATNRVSVIAWDTRQPNGETMMVPPGAVGVIRSSDGAYMLRFESDAEGAKQWKRRIFDDPHYKGGVYRDAVTLEEMLEVYAPPGDVHPVTGVDNANIEYGVAVRTMLSKFAAMESRDGTVATPPVKDPEVVSATKKDLYFLITAGHRSETDSGDPTEKSLTGFMADAYVAKLRAAGYAADWYQRDLDNDDLPTMSRGGLDGVALGCGRILAKRTNPLSILLDCHYNGPNSAMHAIVPDVVGLHTAYPGGAPSDDTAANNTEDVKVGMAIAREMCAATGLASYKGMLGLAGIMSERETGVAIEYDARLAMFGATASSRSKAVRLVIEHGGYKNTPATLGNFTTLCADSVVKAINGLYGGVVTPPIVKPTDPKPTPPPVPPVKPSPVAYPAGIGKEVASILFGSVKGTDGRTYGFDENGPVSKMWVAEAKRTGKFPILVSATVIGNAKYFAFANGLLIYTPDYGKDPIRQYSVE